MNIALGALILVLLLLPAISFRFGVSRNPELKELLGTISITDSFWVLIFIPIVIHTMGIVVIHWTIGEIRFNTIYQVIIGNKDFVVHNDYFFKYTLEFLGYSLLCFSAGYLLGYVASELEETENPWLEKITLSKLLGLRNNQWYRLLDADLASAELKRQIDLVYVDILANTKEATTIYSGFVWKFYFKHNSKELAYLVLSKARRRDLRKEYVTNKPDVARGTVNSHSETMGTQIKITPGDLFIIPREEILNINILYIDVPDDPAPPPPAVSETVSE